MLQEYITLCVELGQTHGQILERKSLLRTKTNSHPPSTALLQKGLSPAPFKRLCSPFPCSGGVFYCHCCGSIQTGSCLDAAWKECSGILNCRHETEAAAPAPRGHASKKTPGRDKPLRAEGRKRKLHKRTADSLQRTGVGVLCARACSSLAETRESCALTPY